MHGALAGSDAPHSQSTHYGWLAGKQLRREDGENGKLSNGASPNGNGKPADAAVGIQKGDGMYYINSPEFTGGLGNREVSPPVAASHLLLRVDSLVQRTTQSVLHASSRTWPVPHCDTDCDTFSMACDLMLLQSSRPHRGLETCRASECQVQWRRSPLCTSLIYPACSARWWLAGYLYMLDLLGDRYWRCRP